MNIQELKKFLEESDLISAKDFNNLEKEAKKTNQAVERLLVTKGFLKEQELGQLIASLEGFKFIDLSRKNISSKILNLIPERVAKNQKVIIFKESEDQVNLAMSNPKDLGLIKLIEKKVNKKVVPYYSTEGMINEALNRYKSDIRTEFEKIIEENVKKAEALGKTGEDAAKQLPIVKIVNSIIEFAYSNKSSDIHIEPHENEVIVRFRIDGILHDVLELPKVILDSIIMRFKILAKLRTDEHMSAQDGKIVYKFEKERADLRVSILPISYGEKVVLRILSEQSRKLSLEDLGFQTKDLSRVKRSIKKPYGMILVTGPTGSGKTTTLYAVLKILNKREVNISTIEDPVEYTIDGVNQIQVNKKTNLTFAKGLRSLMRQDPDVVMVGEIRDTETADIAVNAAMTGHLLLSTLHANDSATAVPRLLDMEIEPFLLSSTLNVIIAQRLVRKICDNCLATASYTNAELEAFKKDVDIEGITKKKIEDVVFYKGKGCSVCKNTGYRGRVGIYEVMEVSETIQALIMKRENSDVIKKQAIKEGMTTMIQDGVNKVVLGLTTIEEVLRVSKE